VVTENDLGARVRAFRTLRRMSLRALAESTGLSPSFLSQFENGRTNASIGSLRRLAECLGVRLSDLVEQEVRPINTVLRKADRPQLPIGNGASKFVITQPPLRYVEIYVSEFLPGGSTGTGPYVHGDAQEVVLVLRGVVALYLGDIKHELLAGDSIEYTSSTPHRIVNEGITDAEVLWVTSPPTPDHAPSTSELVTP
jgi:transcriptional regulator with XRE-family HTH domain